MGVVLLSTLRFSKRVDVWDETGDLEVLAPFEEACRTFFKHLGGSVHLEPFWGHNEGQKFATHFVGYDISIFFEGQYSFVSRAIIAAHLFFDLNDAKKTDEKLELIDEVDNS